MLIATRSFIVCTAHCWPLKNLQNFWFLAVPLFLGWLQSHQSDQTKASSSVRSGMKSQTLFWRIYLFCWKKLPSDAQCKTAQLQKAASCWSAKYSFHSGTKGTFVLWFCVSFVQFLSLVSNFSGRRLRLCGLPEECVPRRPGPAVLEVRGQGNSQLSCQKKHRQIGVRESSRFSRPDNFCDAFRFAVFYFFQLCLCNVTGRTQDQYLFREIRETSEDYRQETDKKT